ncbi:MAG TPA: hypothetical protein VH280_08340 [Verrucomicrobiae bacterium]|jgi:hypothetical protein|nr:hypothetical protein [Verrucomicrobiae bacterium]
MQNIRQRSILHLNLHREFFAAIADRTKRIEYRKRSPYWKTGKTFDIFAVIAIPGHEVKETGKGGVRVANPKNLPDVLKGYGKTVLSAEDIKTIRLLLADKCRDVEY